MPLHRGIILISGLLAFNAASADQVKIIAADAHKTGNAQWSVSVTLQHADTGWDHYADRWRVVDEQGKILGDRVLHHPHVNEQPFTRSLANVQIPKGVEWVFIEAHDKVHGWAAKRLKIELKQ